MQLKDKKTLSYEVIGEGTPVLLLHGFLESSTMWEKIVQQLNGYRFYLIDLPGHGGSKGIDLKEWSIDVFADKVIEVIEKEGLSTCSIVGHSLGGYVALEVLKRLTAERCKRLILLNSHPWADRDSKKEERTRVAKVVQQNKDLFLAVAIPNLYNDEKNYQSEIQQLINEASRMETDEVVATIFAMRDREAQENVLIANASRVAVIQGENDRLIDAKEMHSLCSEHNITYVCLSNSGHMAHQEAEKKVIESLESLL